MNITSYNITDVGFHYIGLRVLASMPNIPREEQFRMVSRNVSKYARDKALRLMLPEPRGSFDTAGEKACQELAHFRLAYAQHGRGYELTEAGSSALRLLETKQHAALRRLMTEVHLRSYDNLRGLLKRYLEFGPIFSPIVEVASANDKRYLTRLLAPTFKGSAAQVVNDLFDEANGHSAKKIEDILRQRVLTETLPGNDFSVSLFRSICDRLVSLRLLNIMKTTIGDCEFAKSYSPCVAQNPVQKWHRKLELPLESGGTFSMYLSEPEMSDPDTQQRLIAAVKEASEVIKPQAGYLDLPEVRDYSCEKLMIAEAAFDEGVNLLLDLHPSPLTLGLQYERISGRRKPLIRNRESVQIFNLIRSA